MHGDRVSVDSSTNNMAYNSNGCTISEHSAPTLDRILRSEDSRGNTDYDSLLDSVSLKLVENFFESQLSLKGVKYSRQSKNDLSSDYHSISDAFEALGKAFIRQYETKITNMVHVLEMSPTNIAALFDSVSNELYVEGIKWSHIITHFVFSVEFAHHASQQGMASHQEVAQRLALFLSERLLPWIEQNEGWVRILHIHSLPA